MPRRPGRPPLDERDTTVSIHLRVPSKDFDALDADVRHQRVTMPELIRRRALTRRERPREDDRDDR